MIAITDERTMQHAVASVGRDVVATQPARRRCSTARLFNPMVVEYDTPRRFIYRPSDPFPAAPWGWRSVRVSPQKRVLASTRKSGDVDEALDFRCLPHAFEPAPLNMGRRGRISATPKRKPDGTIGHGLCESGLEMYFCSRTCVTQREGEAAKALRKRRERTQCVKCYSQAKWLHHQATYSAM
jgi:hypothetical protein